MLTFNEWLNYPLNEAETVFKHSTHVEDLIFTSGKKGAQKALAGLLHVRKILGKSSSKVEIQRKMDGAPSCIFGYIQNKFFVATKSLFNKEPKINFTHEDIDKNHSGDLAKKLHLALDLLKDITPKNKIIQSDLLFDNETLKEQNIDDIDYYTFHPNTIKYAVQKDTPLGKAIKQAKLGLVVHTEYNSDGENISSIKLKGFNVTEDMFKKSKDVWLTDTSHKDVSKIATFNSEESKEITELSSVIKTSISSIKFDSILKELYPELLTFVNTYIRANVAMPNANTRTTDFLNYIKQKYEKELNSKKTDKAKQKVSDKFEPLLNNIENNRKQLTKLFELHSALTILKLIMIQKLESIKNMNTFLEKMDGTLEVTGSEGYVITTTSASGAKLVDRYQFSKSNFSSEFKKGWEHK